MSKDSQTINLDNVKLMLGIEDDSEDGLLAYLYASAKDIVLARRYPFHDYPEEFPVKYEFTVERIVIFMYNKMGAEGETSHSVGGISRSWEDSDIPNELLQDVVPLGEFIL